MFPGPNATVYYNEAGEPLGWSDESYYEPEPMDDYEYDRKYGARDARAEECYEIGKDHAERGEDKLEEDDFEHTEKWEYTSYCDGYADGSPVEDDDDDEVLEQMRAESWLGEQ